jgi:hypothetical protein
MDRDSRSIEPRVVSQRLRSVQRLAIGRTASQDGRHGAPRLSYGATVPVSAGPSVGAPQTVGGAEMVYDLCVFHVRSVRRRS